MKYIYKVVCILIFVSFIGGCSEDDSGPTETENNSFQIEKSKKRGISYNLTNDLDLEALKTGVSWWYNWYFKPDAPEGYYNTYEM
jgi:hypothetical protein